jgi:ABC-type amino acid transport substrate-binding protein
VDFLAALMRRTRRLASARQGGRGSRVLHAALGAAACLALAPGLSSAAEPLRICVPDASPPYSWREARQPRGFDIAVGREVAARMGREARFFWYESGFDRESDQVSEIDAMLSAKLCDLAAGFALYATALDPPSKAVGRTPDYDGAKPLRQRPWIHLQQLGASLAYHNAPMTVVLGPGAAGRSIRTLADLQGLRVGTVASSLGGTILRGYHDGLLRAAAVSLQSIRDPLAGLEAGQYDATLVDLHELDAYRMKNPQTRLVDSGYRHWLSFNLGYALLASDGALLASVNEAIQAGLKEGRFRALAEQVPMSYVPPAEPRVQPPLSFKLLFASDQAPAPQP